MPHKIFAALNEEKINEGEPVWANPRNAAAGSLKLLDPNEVARRKLSVVFYGVAEDSAAALKDQHHCHAYLHNLGLPTLQCHALCHSLDEIWAFTEKVKKLRSTLEYDIDGVVIKLNDLREQKRLGNTVKNPRWAIAYKFAAEQAITRIHAITVQVGRTGVLTPVAELEPVVCAGSTIARATLHNKDEIKRKDIRIGDTVIIEKGGDVIPKVVAVDLGKRQPSSHPWHMPVHCPSCGAGIVKIENEVAARCPNTKHCPEQQLRSLIYFISKPAMDIDNMGEKVAAHLMQKKFVQHPSDIFRLTAEQLYQLEGFKEKSVQNLLASIEKAKNVSLARFIMALGIKHIGTGTAELLANKSGTIEALMQMTAEDLMRIEGVGEKVANAVVEYFANEANRKEVAALLELGVRPGSSRLSVL